MNWATGSGDNGNVHQNNGPANKAAYLITDGTAAEPNRGPGSPAGTFYGTNIPMGLGVAKAAQIYWRTELMLTPGADYADLANALVAACNALASGGIAVSLRLTAPTS